MTHNLRTNYLNATGAGDNQMRSDILLSELAKLIVYKPSIVVNALKKSNPDFKQSSPSSHDLVRLVAEEIYKSKQFSDLIAKEIVLSHSPQSQERVSADGNLENAIMDGVDIISKGLGNLFGAIKKEIKERDNAKNELKKRVEALGDMDNTKSGLKKLLVATIVWGTVIGGVFGLAYVVKRFA